MSKNANASLYRFLQSEVYATTTHTFMIISPTPTGILFQHLHAPFPVCQSTATNFLSMPCPIPSLSLRQIHRYLLIAALLLIGTSLPGSMLVTETWETAFRTQMIWSGHKQQPANYACRYLPCR